MIIVRNEHNRYKVWNSLYGEYDTNQHFHYTVTIQLNQGVKTLFGT